MFEAQPSQLSVFEVPPTQTAVEKIYFQEYRPISQLSSNSPIEFSIGGIYRYASITNVSKMQA